MVSKNKTFRRKLPRTPTKYVGSVTSSIKSFSSSKRSYTPRTKSTTSVSTKETTKLPPSNVWENIVLYYLSKLKNAWGLSKKKSNHPVAGKRLNASNFFQKTHADTRKTRALSNVKKPLEPKPEKYSSLYPQKIERSKTPPSNYEKAYNIVSNALAYGYVNGIVKKCGKCFYLLPKNKFIKSPMTYDRRNLCKSCRTCNGMHKKRNIEEMDKRNFATNRSRLKKAKRPILPKALPKRKKRKCNNS